VVPLSVGSVVVVLSLVLSELLLGVLSVEVLFVLSVVVVGDVLLPLPVEEEDEDELPLELELDEELVVGQSL
jgi:hypothetical protein